MLLHCADHAHRRAQLAPDGKGRIGVQLASRSYINHIKPGSLGEALAMTWQDFTRLGGVVVRRRAPCCLLLGRRLSRPPRGVVPGWR
jgi:hypothetical protein